MTDAGMIADGPPGLVVEKIVDPFFTYDIGSETSWPNHIRKAIVGSGPEDRLMTLDEIAAVLLHVSMIEVGFIPDFAAMEPRKEYEVLKTVMAVVLRCMTTIPSDQRTQHAMSINYNAVISREHIPDDPNIGGTVELVKSPTIKVVMFYNNGSLSAYSTFAKPCIDIRGLSHEAFNYTFNIRSFIDRIQGFPMDTGTQLKASQWFNIIRMNGSRFSDVIKSQFCIPVLDLLGGNLYEIRIRDVPYEVLVHIFEYLPDSQLKSLREVSRSFRISAEYVLEARSRPRGTRG